MDDESKLKDNVKNTKMGASGNPNAARLAALQERKQVLEETLAKKNLELRELCIKEAELTGIIPSEIPLEPGESPPTLRRRVGTSFQLSQNLVNNLNTEDDSIASVEVSMQVQANMAEAALSLANESNINKTIRRQHMQQYQLHRQQYHLLEEKLAILKNNNQAEQATQLGCNFQVSGQQPKQKKKLREEQDETMSVNINFRQDPFGKPVFRHSMRSLQYPPNEPLPEQKTLSSSHQKLVYRSLDCDSNPTIYRPEDALLPSIYKLSINGYKNYIERKEGVNVSQYSAPPYVHSQPNLNLQHQKHYKPVQYIPTTNSTLPHNLQKHMLSVQNSYPNISTQHYIQSNHTSSQPYEQHKKYYTIGIHGTNSYPNSLNRQSASPNYSNNSLHKTQFYGSHILHNQHMGNSEQSHRTINPHQIQPHQQYENAVMNSGLGGYWKQTETGEMIWCNTVVSDNWKQEKRFGSLDRRRNKRSHHKRTSPSVDPKSATISSCHENVRSKVGKTQHGLNKNHDKQLVRTLSLGSVGAQNIDNVWSSNDNLSTGGEVQPVMESVAEGRKSKQKEWFETSLDGPVQPTSTSRPQSSMSSVLQFPVTKSISPEEKYSEILMRPLPSPDLSKPPLEIPAESKPNPSPIVQEPKIEFFNNIPRNCTLIQPGGCKPYHEETKPFEMSDFYKYSTKFKRSPSKQPPGRQNDDIQNQQVNAETASVILKGVYQPLQPMKCQPLSANENFDTNSITSLENTGTGLNMDINRASPNADISFAVPKKNVWYKNQEHMENVRTEPSPGRSTATLV
ncbi:uncharacterized protein LOC108737338 isoform X2 [Agrilus planipennis]|uniref:Uncharacterized protein LOC108737338 isoform X2 n=1 Tax=Agrilus planipennis TaxID=224129 RepID=A0A1W4WYR1_AGRPL|nr:uncharacterized protein LOC108737338 isoform X2 [Agrilus planipennis]